MRAKIKVTVLLAAAACGVATIGVTTGANAAPTTSFAAGAALATNNPATQQAVVVDAVEAAKIAESQAARRAAGRS